MTGTMWFWRHDSQEGGPVTWDALMALAGAGKLRASDPVLRQGTNAWVRADQARSEGPPGLPQAPPLYPGVPPYMQGAAMAAPPAGMYAGPATGTLAAMGPPSFMPMPSAENGFDGNGVVQGAGESYQGLAIGSLVCGLFGLLCFGWAFGLIAVGCGSKALSGMNTSGNDSGRGLAIAGIVLGVVDVISFVLLLVLRVSAMQLQP